MPVKVFYFVSVGLQLYWNWTSSLIPSAWYTAWKVSIIGVILVRIFPHWDWIRRDTPHFPTFRLNTERYSLSLHIPSECGKMRTRITLNMDTFYAVILCRTAFLKNIHFQKQFNESVLQKRVPSNFRKIYRKTRVSF